MDLVPEMEVSMSTRTQAAALVLAIAVLSHSELGISATSEAENIPQRVTLPRSEVHQIRSEINGRDYDLLVALPMGYSAAAKARHPVLYVLDGGGFLALTAQAHMLMQLNEEVPPLILVGIHAQSGSIMEYLANRVLDFTPTRNLEAETEATAEYGHEVRSGGGDDFLRVLVEEIIPWTEGRYLTAPERGLAGFSYGGLFAIHALLRAPRAFTHYLIGSPDLNWDDAVMFEREAAYAAENKELKARVFMSVGSLEEYFYVPNMLRMAETLTSHDYTGLEVMSHIFEGETHQSVIPATMSRGMRFLFGTPE